MLIAPKSAQMLDVHASPANAGEGDNTQLHSWRPEMVVLERECKVVVKVQQCN